MEANNVTIINEMIEQITKKRETRGVKMKGGKTYTMVQDRVETLRRMTGDYYQITTEMLQYTNEPGGSIVFRAVIRNADGQTVATGHAEEIRGSSQITDTSAIEVCECVPLETEIMTRDGWKNCFQLKIGEPVATYGNGGLEWQPLDQIGIFRNVPLVEISNKRLLAWCTPNHKWLVKTQHGQPMLEQLDRLTSSHALVIAARELGGQHTTEISDREAAILGWAITDGEMHWNNGIPSGCSIRQSKPETVEVLDELLSGIAERRQCKLYNDGWLQPYEWGIPAEFMQNLMLKCSIGSRQEFSRAAACIPLSGAEAMHKAMMQADGYGKTFAKTHQWVMDVFHILCMRLGIAVGRMHSRMQEKATKPIYSSTMRRGTSVYVSELQRKIIPPTSVWSPTIANGTWVARFRGQPFITGNTSAIGRALAVLGIHGGEFASAEELAIVVSKLENKQARPAKPAPVVVAAPTARTVPPVASALVHQQAVKDLSAQLDIEQAVEDAGGKPNGLHNAQIMKDVREDVAEMVSTIKGRTPVLKPTTDCNMIAECFFTFMPLCTSVEETYSFWYANEGVLNTLKANDPKTYEEVKLRFVARRDELKQEVKNDNSVSA